MTSTRVALWSYVVGLTNGDRGPAGAGDLFRSWRNPAVLDRATGSGRSWLFTAAKRIVIDEWRSARRPASGGDRSGSRADRRGRRRSRPSTGTWSGLGLRTLSAEHRQVLLECYFRGASVAQAAQDAGRANGHDQDPHPLRASCAASGHR